MSVATIQAEVLSLPPGERAKLIDVLWESLASPEVTSREAAWARESDRRIDAFEAGQLKARDGRPVLSELRKGLRTWTRDSLPAQKRSSRKRENLILSVMDLRRDPKRWEQYL